MKGTVIAWSSLFLLVPSWSVAETPGRVPAYLIELPESVSEVLIADTGAPALHRFERTATDVVRVDGRYMSIGVNGVGKKRAWDKKTPLGIYFITERLDTSNMDDKYGIAAYPLDYPNAWDVFNGRGGAGIWLHGVDRNGSVRPPRDTDGCLAISNDDLRLLGASLEPLVTPLIVARELAWTSSEDIEKKRAEFRGALEMWRSSLERSDRPALLSIYSEQFRHRGMDRDAWSAQRFGMPDDDAVVFVELSDVLLVADPEEDGLFLSRFTQSLVTARETVRTTRRLYWRRLGANAWRIIAEDTG